MHFFFAGIFSVYFSNVVMIFPHSIARLIDETTVYSEFQRFAVWFVTALAAARIITILLRSSLYFVFPLIESFDVKAVNHTLERVTSNLKEDNKLRLLDILVLILATAALISISFVNTYGTGFLFDAIKDTLMAFSAIVLASLKKTVPNDFIPKSKGNILLFLALALVSAAFFSVLGSSESILVSVIIGSINSFFILFLMEHVRTASSQSRDWKNGIKNGLKEINFGKVILISITVSSLFAANNIARLEYLNRLHGRYSFHFVSGETRIGSPVLTTRNGTIVVFFRQA